MPTDTRAKAGKNPGARSWGAASQPGPGLGKLAAESMSGIVTQREDSAYKPQPSFSMFPGRTNRSTDTKNYKLSAGNNYGNDVTGMPRLPQGRGSPVLPSRDREEAESKGLFQRASQVKV